MKTIAEFINESLHSKLINVYPLWDNYLACVNSDRWDIKDFQEELNITGSEAKKIIKILDAIEKYIIKADNIFLGNWDPDYDEEEDSWKRFYKKSKCKNDNKCIVCTGDGDDGVFYYLELKPDIDQKLIDEFVDLFDDSWCRFNIN